MFMISELKPHVFPPPRDIIFLVSILSCGGGDGKYVIDTSILEILDPSSQYLSDTFSVNIFSN